MIVLFFSVDTLKLQAKHSVRYFNFSTIFLSFKHNLIINEKAGNSLNKLLPIPFPFLASY